MDTAEKMVEIVAKGDQISELNWETKSDRDYVIFPGCVEKVRCKIKDPKMNNPINKVVIFSPFEELVEGTALVIFESAEVWNCKKKFIDIIVYNPTWHRMFVTKGSPMGQISDISAAFTLPIYPEGGISLNEIRATKGTEEENLRKHDLHHLTTE